MEEMSLQLNNTSLNCSNELSTDESEPLELPLVYNDVNVAPELDKEVLASTISNLQEEMSALRSEQKYLEEKRKQALQRMLDIKGNIRVFCRVKLIENKRIKSPLMLEQEKVTVRSVGVRKEFILDRVFPQESNQEEVFNEVKPLIQSALDGHNVCILAYGQTGTGKTYTMEGTKEQPGIVPRTIEEIFQQISEDKSGSLTISMSMLEIYTGSLRDLLAEKISIRTTYTIPKCNINIQNHGNGAVEIEGLNEVELANIKQATRWYIKGKRTRSTSWTNVNETSSRSHCLTRITIWQSGNDHGGKRVLSKLWLVDLGGSERLSKTGAIGQTLDEGKAINLSLSALGDVIAALKLKLNHIPFRNSKLTQILSDSLGNGSKVLMLVNISPSEDDIAETVCSLSFAKRARAVEVHKELSEDMKKRKRKSITELDQHLQSTEQELVRVRNEIERTETIIQEKKKILRVTYSYPADEKGSPRSTLVVDHMEITDSPQGTEKTVEKAPPALPHFMSSTVCSRQRKNTTESVSKTRSLKKPPNKLLLDSQTYSTGGHDNLTPKSCSSKHKPVAGVTNNSIKHRDLAFNSYTGNVSQTSFESKTPTFSRSRRLSGPITSSKFTLHQHRRRMSDFT